MHVLINNSFKKSWRLKYFLQPAGQHFSASAFLILAIAGAAHQVSSILNSEKLYRQFGKTMPRESPPFGHKKPDPKLEKEAGRKNPLLSLQN